MTKYYKLLKDTPMAKAGTIYKDNNTYLSDLPNNVGVFYIPDIKDFDEWFKEVDNPNEPNHSLGWQPKPGDTYHIADISGKVYGYTYHSDGTDNSFISRGDAKRTADEAELEMRREEALHKIHRYMYENGMMFTPNFSGEEVIYQIVGWDYRKNTPATDWWRRLDTSQHRLMFRSEEDRRIIINKFPDELKLILKRW